MTVALLVGALGQTLLADEVDPGTSFARAFDARQRHLQTARYQLIERTTVKRGRFGTGPDGPLPAQDVELLTKREILIDVARQSLRNESHTQVWDDRERRFRPETAITVCDGRMRFTHKSRASNTTPLFAPSASRPEVIVQTEKLQLGGMIDASLRPVLWAQGCYPVEPLAAKWLATDAVFKPSEQKSEEGFVLLAHVKDREFDTNDCDRLTVERRTTFPHVVRWERVRHGVARFRLQVEWAQEGDFDYPRRWSVFQFASTTPVARCEVTSFVTNPVLGSEQFELPCRPGDTILLNGKFHVVSASQDEFKSQK